MADIKGLGLCGICMKDLQDPTTGTSGPIRHFKGHQLAHKNCFDQKEAFEKTHEFKVQQAELKLTHAQQKVAVAEAEVRGAQAALDALNTT
jgi:hypothetical protein